MAADKGVVNADKMSDAELSDTPSVESPRQGKAGVSYELTYKPASGQKPPESPRMPSCNSERVQTRLKEAEDRRISLEAAKIEAVKARNEKVEGKREKRQQEENIFRKETQEQLERDMMMAEERRQENLNIEKNRLRKHLERVKEAQEKLAQKCVELEAEIGQKLTEASEKRSARINEVKERAQEHLLHVKEVMLAADQLTKEEEKMTAINSDIERTLKNREEQMGAMLQRLHDHSAKVEKLRRDRAAAALPTPTPSNDHGEAMQVETGGTPKRH